MCEVQTQQLQKDEEGGASGLDEADLHKRRLLELQSAGYQMERFMKERIHHTLLAMSRASTSADKRT